MFVKIVIESVNSSSIILPFYYQRDIQGFIYNSIHDHKFAEFLHNKGYSYKKRNFKLFSFSQILNNPIKIDRNKKTFYFGNSVSLIISTVQNNLLNSLADLINRDNFKLGINKVKVTQIKLYPYQARGEERVTALSPVCCYSTVQVQGKGKRTIFYHPYEKEFAELARINLLHKFQAFYNRLPDNTNFSLCPLSRPIEKTVCYKGFLTKGYSGDFLLSGSPQLIQMALDAGLCNKGSTGHGLIIPKQLLEAV